MVTIGKENEALWLDCINPTVQELETLGNRFGLDAASIHDCMQPEHLPKLETFESAEFLILRTFDSTCAPDADTTQELTRKISVFRKSGLLITIHRADLRVIERIRSKWIGRELSPDHLNLILYEIFLSVLTSYDHPIDHSLDRLEALEKSVFNLQSGQTLDIREAYYLKRRAFIFRRVFRSTMAIFHRLSFGKSVKGPMLQTVRDEMDSSLYYTEELTESVTSLMSLAISLSAQRTNEASQQTNEVVRVLTIFSVFLLPLNVITGVYGMNFEQMPELKWSGGYYFALGLMALTVLTTFLWFRFHGYLRGGFTIGRRSAKTPK